MASLSKWFQGYDNMRINYDSKNMIVQDDQMRNEGADTCTSMEIAKFKTGENHSYKQFLTFNSQDLKTIRS